MPLLPLIHPVAQQASFAIITLLTTLPTWAVAKVGLVIVSIVPEGKRPAAELALHWVTYKCLNWSWWWATKFSFWIRFRCEGISELRRGLNKGRGKPRCLLLNHLSFFDSILGLSLMPFDAISDMKTMAASYVFKMPIIGPISHGCGHLGVPFASNKDDNFSVDKEAVANIQLQMDDHVRGGGIGCWFPEGALNSGDGTQLRQFRAGGFHLPSTVDCEIWCICMLGNAVMWPKKAAVGGLKSKIGITAFRLCESSLEMCADAEVPEGVTPERAKALHLANQAQKRFQEELDKLVAAEWGSIPKVRSDEGKKS